MSNQTAQGIQQNNMIQIQMLGQMTQQMGLLTAMNALLSQLNTGFAALTRAIMENTRTLGQIAISKGFFSRQYMQQPTQGGIPANIIDAYINFGIAIDETALILQKSLGPIQQFGQTLSKGGTGGGWKSSKSIFDSPTTTLSSMLNLGGVGTSAKMGYQAGKFGSQLGGGAEVLGGVGGGIISAFQNIRSNMKGMTLGGQAKSVMAPFGNALASLGPQFALMAIVMQPVQALLEGLFEPFEMVTDVFGSWGAILGTAFLPVLEAIMPLLNAFTPVIAAIAPILGQVILIIFQFLTPIGQLMPIIMAIVTAIGNFLPVITAILVPVMAFVNQFNLISVAIGIVVSGGTSLVTFFTVTLPNAWSNLGQSFTTAFNNLINGIMQFFKDAVEEVRTLGAAKTQTFG